MYKLYLAVDDGKEGFNAPLLPDSIKFSDSSSLTSETLVSGIEISTNNVLSLRTVQFDLIFTRVNALDPEVYISMLRRWQEQKKKVRFIYVKDNKDINMLSEISDCPKEEKGGDVGTIYCSIRLTEYRPPEIRKIVYVDAASTQTAAATVTTTTQRSDNRTIPDTYTFVRGDSLWLVAKKFYGDGNRWPEIAKLNNIQPSQYNNLPVGLVVRLP